MGQDFFASLSAIGNQTAVQSQINASSSTNRPNADAFARLFAQNQIDAERRRDDRPEQPVPAIATNAPDTSYDFRRIDQPTRRDEPPTPNDSRAAPPHLDDRSRAAKTRSEGGRLHSYQGQTRADAAHARQTERTASRQADQASDRGGVGDADHAAGDTTAASDQTVESTAAVDGKPASKPVGSTKKREAKGLEDAPSNDQTSKGENSKGEAGGLLAGDVIALVTADPAVAVAIEVQPALANVALTATATSQSDSNGIVGAKPSSTISPELATSKLATSKLATKDATAIGEDDATATEKTDAANVKFAIGTTPAATPKGLDQALKILGQLPTQTGAAATPTVEGAIQKAIASFDGKVTRPDAGIKAIAGDQTTAPVAFASNILLNAALPDASNALVQPGTPTVAAQHPATLAALPVAIGSRALNGGREFTIHLYPAELGKVEVKLEISEKGDVKAKLTVDRVETLQLLQRDARALHQALEQAGFKPSEDCVQFSLRQDNGQQASQRQPGWEEQSRRPLYADPDATDISEPSRDVTAAVLSAYARRGNSALDIHI